MDSAELLFNFYFDNEFYFRKNKVKRPHRLIKPFTKPTLEDNKKEILKFIYNRFKPIIDNPLVTFEVNFDGSS
jgi:hypothetical protein